jgi:hypothetical protein
MEVVEQRSCCQQTLLLSAVVAALFDDNNDDDDVDTSSFEGQTVCRFPSNGLVDTQKGLTNALLYSFHRILSPYVRTKFADELAPRIFCNMVTHSTVSIQDTGHEQTAFIAVAVVVASLVLLERSAALPHKASILIDLVQQIATLVSRQGERDRSFLSLPSISCLEFPATAKGWTASSCSISSNRGGSVLSDLRMSFKVARTDSSNMILEA